MTIELSEGGYEKIDAQIQVIEDLAYDGMFSNGEAPKKCQQITLEIKKMRQILREILVLVPAPKAPGGEGSAV
jgi:hypothetical protein